MRWANSICWLQCDAEATASVEHCRELLALGSCFSLGARLGCISTLGAGRGLCPPVPVCELYMAASVVMGGCAARPIAASRLCRQGFGVPQICAWREHRVRCSWVGCLR